MAGCGGFVHICLEGIPVYELLGYKGVGTDLFPGMDNGLMEGRLTYRQHHGGHEAGPNWPFFLDFFEREVLRK